MKSLPDINKYMLGKPRRPTVCYPMHIEGPCELWGYHFPDTNYYNIVALSRPETAPGAPVPSLLGNFLTDVSQSPGNGIYGYRDSDGKVIFHDHLGRKCDLEPVCLKMDIFSRNTGILESDTMLRKGAVIIGCGSVGSLVALELARAGVGRFFLIDMDVMRYHNICRHQCGIHDVGKFKTTALRERILQINPSALVKTSNRPIQSVPLAEIEPFCDKDTVMVGCADNREGDFYAAQLLAKPNGMAFISIGCWERAFAGEIFYCLPDGMPDYSDFMASITPASRRVEANTHLYMGEVGSFEPGISADINFVTTIGVKMILDLLNRDTPAYTCRLLDSLTQYTLICNTDKTAIGGDMAEIFSYPLQVTRSIEVDYAPQDSTSSDNQENVNF